MKRNRKKMASLAATGRYAFVGGPFGSKLTRADYVEDGVPVIRGTNMGGASRFIGGDFVFVSESKADTLVSNMAHPGDLIFTQRGTLGQVALVPPTAELGDQFVVSQSQMKVTIDPEKADIRYLYYYFTSPEIIEDLKARAITSGVPHINLTILREYEVSLPGVHLQHRIADILSAYDDLIENNNRRMALLEESIHLLYREWFVYLRFPGHERVEVVDGVPEGWSRGKASDAVTVQSGGTPKTKVPQYWDGDIPFFTPKDAPDGVYVHTTEKSVTESGVASCNSKLYPSNSIFITARGTVGKVALAHRPMAMNQSCYRLEPREPYGPYFLYPALGEVVRYLKAAAVGGVFSTIIVRTFDHVPMLLPIVGAVREFERTATPIFDELRVLDSQNRKLREARDLLLPRLMDGRIPV